MWPGDQDEVFVACLRWRAQRRQDVEEGVGVDGGFGGEDARTRNAVPRQEIEANRNDSHGLLLTPGGP